MGNDLSTKTARTLIPLDDSVCWQLYNSINERSEPISIFVSKQTYSVECRRSIQFLKTVRHPNIIKFYTGFKTFVEQDSFIADCVHPLANKLDSHEFDSTAKLTLGLYQLTQALQFLHEKASISHNNVCLSSLYISLNGIWKLGNFECACRYENLNKKYLSSLKLIRAEECITPEEEEKNTNEIPKDHIFALDVYGLGKLLHHLMSMVHVDDSLRGLLTDLEETLSDEEAQSRPKWSNLLRTELFQIDYIKATELLDRLPTIDESDLSDAVDCLSNYLDDLRVEYFNELLMRRLFTPFMFLCSSTRAKIIPRILIPRDEQNASSWVDPERYRSSVLPIVVDLFTYHVTCIRETLLEHFNSYANLIDKTTLTNVILPQLIYGLKDSNNRICTLTLMALATIVPVLGADVVVGGQRRPIFTDTLKKDNVVFPKTSKIVSTSNSPLPTPPPTQKVRKPSPVANIRTKPLRTKPASSPPAKQTSDTNEIPPAPLAAEYTNGHHSPPKNSLAEPQAATTVVANGHQSEEEFDHDQEQWSDWEHQSDAEVFTSETPTVAFSPQPIPEQATLPPPVSLPAKSLQTNSISKPKWDPNAPLGSEFAISSAASKKTKSSESATSIKDDSDDFFKDMAPKVATVELMTQLETMFNLNSNQSKQPSTASSSSFPNKFGMMSEHPDDHQEIASGSNNWDE